MPFEEDYSELIVTSMRPKVITVASRRDAKTVESGYSNVLQHAAFIARQLDSRVRPDPLPILHPASQISLFIGGTSMRLEITIASRRDANAVELGHRNVPQPAAFIARQLDSRVRRVRRLRYLSLPASQICHCSLTELPEPIRSTRRRAKGAPNAHQHAAFVARPLDSRIRRNRRPKHSSTPPRRLTESHCS
jgi:hypothetical protein